MVNIWKLVSLTVFFFPNNFFFHETGLFCWYIQAVGRTRNGGRIMTEFLPFLGRIKGWHEFTALFCLETSPFRTYVSLFFPVWPLSPLHGQVIMIVAERVSLQVTLLSQKKVLSILNAFQCYTLILANHVGDRWMSIHKYRQWDLFISWSYALCGRWDLCTSMRLEDIWLLGFTTFPSSWGKVPEPAMYWDFGEIICIFLLFLPVTREPSVGLRRLPDIAAFERSLTNPFPFCGHEALCLWARASLHTWAWSQCR